MKNPTILFLAFLFPAAPAFAGSEIKGCASYLVAPLGAAWVEAYRMSHSGLKARVEAKKGSELVRQWLSGGGDFALVDTPLTPEEEKKILAHPAFQLPVALQAVAITYNLPGVPGGLRLSPGLLSRIFMGTVKNWNDPRIAQMNPGVSLPPMAIQVLVQEEESDSRDLFPSLLSKWDPAWAPKNDKDRGLKWPVGRKVRGNDKIYEKMRKWPGVLAAMDLSFALQKNLPLASIQNEAGRFLLPSLDSVSAAASDLTRLPENFQVALSRSSAPGAYPLSSLSWFLVSQDLYKRNHDHGRSKALVDLLEWILGEGQKVAVGSSDTPLPENFREQVLAKVREIKY